MRTEGFKQIFPYVLFIGIGFFLFPSAGYDDVHITYWAAHSLSQFGEILNYNGDRIEQSSSLLHVLILASINHLSKLNIVDIGSFLSVFFGLLTVHLTGNLLAVLNKEPFSARLIAATSAPILFWSFGGLETSMTSAIILCVIIHVIKYSVDKNLLNYILSIFSIFLYLLVRPEAFFVIVSFFTFLLFLSFLKKEDYSSFIIFIAATILLFILIEIVRYSYFGAFFPQAVSSKVGGSIIYTIRRGIRYYYTSLIQYPFFIFLVLPIIILLLRRKETIKNTNLVIIISWLIIYASCVLFEGGDWMNGARFFVPIIAPAIVIASYFFISLLGWKRTIIYGISLNILCLVNFHIKYSTSFPLISSKSCAAAMQGASDFSFFETSNAIHYRDIPTSIELKSIVKKMVAKGMHPVIMSGQGGMVPYHLFLTYFKQARFIEQCNLTTRDFLDCDITSSIPQKRYVHAVGLEYIFSHIEKLRDACGIDPPDIIYEIGMFEDADIEKYGYTLVYQQTAQKVAGRHIGSQFIAVKTDIASQLQLKTTRFIFQPVSTSILF